MKFVGVLLVIAGIVLGLYAGVWWALIGGIVMIVEAVKSTPVDAMDLALGVVRVLFAGAIGGLAAFLLVVPGAALFNSR